MNKKILMAVIALITVAAYNISFAADTEVTKAVKQGAVNKAETQNVQKAFPCKNDFRPPMAGEFQGKPPCAGEFGKHHHGDMQKFHPSKAEMEKKKAEFDKRLKLTDAQKKQIDENRKLGHEQVKPIFEQKRAKMNEIREINKNSALSEAQKLEKTKALKADIKKLDDQANAYREQNMKAFENILSEKQKKEFDKIKQEQKKDMEKRKAEFEKKMEKAKKDGKKPEGFPPPPPPQMEK